MKHLSALHKYFWKYRVRFLAGIFFVATSNYFTVLAPEVTGYVVGQVQQFISNKPARVTENYSKSVQLLINWLLHFVHIGPIDWQAGRVSSCLRSRHVLSLQARAGVDACMVSSPSGSSAAGLDAPPLQAPT